MRLQGTKDRQEDFITIVRTTESGNRTRRLTVGQRTVTGEHVQRKKTVTRGHWTVKQGQWTVTRGQEDKRTREQRTGQHHSKRTVTVQQGHGDGDMDSDTRTKGGRGGQGGGGNGEQGQAGTG